MRRFIMCSIVAVTFGIAAETTHAKSKKEAYEGPHGVFHSRAVKPLKTEKSRITQYRRKVMRALSGHFRALEIIVRQDAPFAASRDLHAQALEALAGTLGETFVKGSEMTPGKWGAKPAIWAEPEKFRRHLTGFAASTRDVRAAIRQGDASRVLKTFKLMRHERLTCHKVLRKRTPNNRRLNDRRGNKRLLRDHAPSASSS